MRVLMRTQYAGPSGSAAPGGIIDLSEAEAGGLIAGGYAEAVETALAPIPAPVAEAVAEAAIAAAPETATAPPSRGRGGRRGR